MTIKMQKTAQAPAKTKDLLKPATKAKTKLTAEQRTQVDTLAEIEATMLAMKHLSKQQDELKKSLKSVADEIFADNEPAVLIGNTGQVTFSPKTDTRYVKDLNGLIGVLKPKIGYPALVGLLKISLSDIEKYLTPAEYAPFLDTKPGTRSLVASSTQT